MKRGFSLVELVVAVGILALALLALFSVLVSSLRAQQKGTDEVQAALLAERELKRVITEVGTNGSTTLFAREYPYPSTAWTTHSQQVGGTTFECAVYAETVRNQLTGAALGSGGNSLKTKKVDVVVTWLGDEGQGRQGYGRLQAAATGLVSERGATP